MDAGVDVLHSEGRGGGYYVGSRTFELAELKLLVDAVQSSRFITQKKSEQLIGKLESLCNFRFAREPAPEIGPGSLDLVDSLP